RRCVGEHREDVSLGVPERVAAVAGACEAFPGNGALLRAGAGLQGVEECEANRELELQVALELAVRGSPGVAEVRTLTVQAAARGSFCGGNPGSFATSSD